MGFTDDVNTGRPPRFRSQALLYSILQGECPYDCHVVISYTAWFWYDVLTMPYLMSHCTINSVVHLVSLSFSLAL